MHIFNLVCWHYVVNILPLVDKLWLILVRMIFKPCLQQKQRMRKQVRTTCIRSLNGKVAIINQCNMKIRPNEEDLLHQIESMSSSTPDYRAIKWKATNSKKNLFSFLRSSSSKPKQPATPYRRISVPMEWNYGTGTFLHNRRLWEWGGIDGETPTGVGWDGRTTRTHPTIRRSHRTTIGLWGVLVGYRRTQSSSVRLWWYFSQ